MVTVRKSILGVFIVSLLFAAYLGFALIELSHDKAIHFITFLILTVEFYFIFDTQHKSIKMVRLLTLAVCTIGGGIFSELIQLVINSTRIFDLHDIIANILGSLTGLLGCTIYEHYAIKWAKARRSRAVHNYVQLETIPEESPITPGVKDLVADQV